MSSSLPERVLALPALWVREAARRRQDETGGTDTEETRSLSAEESDIVESAPREESDESLLTRLKAQDEAALALLFERYADLVFAIGFRILRDRGEAEDLVQTVFTYLWQRADLYDPERGRAKGWILQKSYSRAFDRRDYLVHRQFYRGTDAEVPPDTIVGNSDLEREVTARLNRAQLLEALKELPERQRVTLLGSFFEGLDLKEIAEQLGEPLHQVRHHYYRGLERLRKSEGIQAMRGT